MADYVGTDLNDTIAATDLADTVRGKAGHDKLSGLGGDDLIYGEDGNDTIGGGLGNDSLDGGLGNDSVYGGEGNDTIMGGAGDDRLVGEHGNDEIHAGDGNDGVWGGGSDDRIWGDNGNDNLVGDMGDDEIHGGAGTDRIIGGLGADQMFGDAGDDTFVLAIGDGNDRINDTGGVDALSLETGLTATSFSRAGNDLIVNLSSGDRVTIVDQFVGSVVERMNYASGTSIDLINGINLYIVGTPNNDTLLAWTGNDTIIALGSDDRLEGLAGNDSLDGGAGNDTMVGGTGNDIYIVDNSGDVIIENAGEGTDTVFTSSSYVLSSNIENVTLTGAADLTIGGNASGNQITGNSGNNTIDGGAGVDTMQGGTGDDTYVVDNAGDIVIEAASAGTDAVQSSVTYALTANLENLTLTGAGNVNGTGNTLDNVVSGNGGNNALDGGAGNDTLSGAAGNDTLTGGAGNDSLSGGIGDDTYIIDAGDTVSESAGEGTDTVVASISYTLGANIENLTLIGAGSLSGTGNSLNNLIIGNAGNSTLDGGAGADTMQGGTGNDLYVVDSAGDVVIEAAGAGTDTVQSFINYTLGANLENLTLTGSADLTGTGNTLNNLVVGNAGNNTLAGGGGIDTLQGGAGDDTYIVDSTNDVVIEDVSAGSDMVQASISYTLGANIEALVLTGAGNIAGTGNAQDNTIIGNSASNALDGGAGDDSLSGGAGNDTLTGGAGNDSLSGGIGDDTYIIDAGDTVSESAGEGTDTVVASISYTLGANIENLTLIGAGSLSGTGNSLNNLIIGNAGNSTLDGGAGADTMQGGAGNDTYIVDNVGDVITEAASAGTDTVQSSVSYTLSANVEDLILTGSASLTGTGNTLANTITGNGGNNTLDGGAGNDTMVGGAGNDTYYVDAAGDVVSEKAGEGTDTVIASFSYTLGANIENLTLTGAGSLSGTGNSLDNLIIGNSGNSTLDGGAGNDTMQGGAGNDLYVVDSAGDVVIEAAGAGADTVRTSISYTLGANVENLTLIGAVGLAGTGNGLNNLIVGNSGNSTLDGGAGADTMQGGTGNDTYIVDNVGDVVTEAASAGTDTVQSSVSYTLGANVENLILTGSGNFTGTGNALANTITGNGGNNTLDGGAGNDTMAGGAGDDTYLVDAAGDVVNENAGEGTDTVIASFSYALGANIENLTLTGAGSLSGTGNSLDNLIIGNSGNSTLDGGAGNDTMQGGAGNDLYVVDSAGDVVIEAAGAGADTVRTSISYTLGANVENLTLIGAVGLAGTGNGLNNLIVGNSGNSTLDGGAGADTMQGGTGNDTYIVDNVGDVVTEAASAGTDTVQSSVSYTLGANVENLILTGSGNFTGTGNALANTITGNGGNNTLDGGAGNDTMAGGAGDDTYYVDTAGDVVNENAGEGTDTVIASFSYALGANIENLTLTGAGSLSGTGNSLDNLIIGNSGNSTLDGGAGNDTMQGGTGNDLYVVDSAGDVVIEAAGAGTDTVRTSISYTLGANLENLTLIGSASLVGTGNALNNLIIGNSGNSTLDGGAGADTMQGGTGNDTYIVDNVADIVTEAASAGTDVVLASTSYTLGANVENLTLTGTGSINGTGNGLDNVITGNSGANILTGGAGNDTMVGGAGNDSYYVDSSADVIVENTGEGTDTVYIAASYVLGANLENLTLTGTAALSGTGNALNNLIIGNSGNSTLDGGAGADTMQGGTGNDTYYVDNAGDVVTENLSSGTDLVLASVSYSLTANVENLTLIGSDNLSGGGNTLNNVLTGNSGNNGLKGDAGNDTLNGGLGVDTLAGGTGDDTYVVDSTTDTIFENAGEGSDTVQSSVTYTLGANLENLTLTGSADINGTGNSLNNVVNGNSGNNVLDGGAGVDTLAGGLGNDTYIVDSTTDVITELLGQGTDTVQSSVAHTLGANIENLTLTGASNINGTGNTLDNAITGNSANNVLDGGSGNDTLSGGLGNDTYVVDSTTDLIIENAGEGTDAVLSSVSYVLSANLESLTLTGSANIDGTGNGSNNTITGNSGNNVLDGGLGVDTLAGGLGNDTYIVDSTTDVITENAGEGTDFVNSSVTYALGANLENLTLTGSAQINGTGNSLNNVVTGNSGNNVLDGGTGVDTLIGGAGNDTYLVDTTTDVITELAGQGTDTVQSSVTYTLGANLENLTLTGSSNISGTGNVLDNLITGNSGNNLLVGGAGNDTISGGAGQDTLQGGEGNDVLIGSASAVTYDGGAGIDTLDFSAFAGAITVDETNASSGADDINIEIFIGTANADRFIGGTTGVTFLGGGGNDWFHSGSGVDTMTGGAGNDTFYWKPADVTSSQGASFTYYGRDTVTDFGSGDVLDLSNVTRGVGNQPITSIVQLTDTAAGTVVNVWLSNQVGHVDVIMLLGVHGLTTQGMINSGAMLV